MSKLREARQALKMTQSTLAGLAGTSQPQVKRLEAGERELTVPWAKRFAPHLKIEWMTLLDDTERDQLAQAGLEGIYKPPPVLMNERDTMPVYASAEGGNGQIIISTDEIDRVPRPFTLEGIPEAYAILITGESMVPAYEPGDYAWVNPRLPWERNTDCILYAIDDVTGESKATIKRLLKWDREAWFLRQYGPPKDFELDRAEWTKHHRVVGAFRRR